MNQSDSQKIDQKRCTSQADLAFGPPTCCHKRVKFDLILSKSVRLQFQEEAKEDILESLVFNHNIICCFREWNRVL